MGFIPIYIKPYEDELLFSWIERLAKANGMSVFSFLNAYGERNSLSVYKWTYDMKSLFYPIYNHIKYPVDIKDLFLQHSTFNLDAITMTQSQQTRYINAVFRPHDVLNRPINSSIMEIKYCPECAREEVEPYLHVSHNLSGVCMCSKHRCRLKVFKGTWGHEMEFNDSDYKDANTYIKDEEGLMYADYVNALHHHTINFNIQDVKAILFDELKSLNYKPSNQYQTLIKDISQSPLRGLFNYDIERFLKVKMVSIKYVYAYELVSLLMFLFPNPHEFLNHFESTQPILETYRCKDCGEEYVATTASQEQGWGCPQCMSKLSTQEALKHIIHTMSDGEYELTSEFKSFSEPIQIYHSKCKDIVKMTPRQFLFDDMRCTCESTITSQMASEAIKKAGKFELLKFRGAENSCKIRSCECGHEFDILYRKFLLVPKCRVCFPKNYDTKFVANRIHNESNGEYDLVGEFINQDTKIKVKHNKCGNIIECLPRHYFGGMSCPTCNSTYAGHWESMYQLLIEYKKEFGDTNIAKRNQYHGAALGLWCNRQRANFKEGILSPIRANKLLDIGFVFEPFEAEWNRRYEQYKRYIKENDTTYISKNTNFEGEHLGIWIRTQRVKYKEGKMSQERIDKLLLLNPDIFN